MEPNDIKNPMLILPPFLFELSLGLVMNFEGGVPVGTIMLKSNNDSI